MAIPAFVKTPTFQVIAWNRASVAVMGDYAKLPERDRNVLRRVFEPGSEEKVHEVEEVRRAYVAAFRVDVARVGAAVAKEAQALVDELTASSPAFRKLWAEDDVRTHGGFTKRLVRPKVGEFALESSVFYIDGAEGLSMFVFTPVDDASARAVAELVRTANRAR